MLQNEENIKKIRTCHWSIHEESFPLSHFSFQYSISLQFAYSGLQLLFSIWNASCFHTSCHLMQYAFNFGLAYFKKQVIVIDISCFIWLCNAWILTTVLYSTNHDKVSYGLIQCRLSFVKGMRTIIRSLFHGLYQILVAQILDRQQSRFYLRLRIKLHVTFNI